VNVCLIEPLGGYCKEYSKGKRPVGVMLEDTWLLKFVLRRRLEAPLTLPVGSLFHPQRQRLKRRRRQRLLRNQRLGQHLNSRPLNGRNESGLPMRTPHLSEVAAR